MIVALEWGHSVAAALGILVIGLLTYRRVLADVD